MEKRSLISIHNSGESLEKSIAIYNATCDINHKFYSEYNVVIYYGHNLPKKVENYSIPTHGTIDFYNTNFSGENWCPPCSKEQLLNMKEFVIAKLLDGNIITNRTAEKLSYNREVLWNFLRQLPIEYLYPEFHKKILQKSEQILGVRFLPINLEKNYKDIYSFLPENKCNYFIYALEQNGIIGRYDMQLPNVPDYKRRLDHLYKDLSRRAILSGNSALLLSSINYLSQSIDGVIGYREHKFYRENREKALQEVLLTRQSVEEPKNTIYNDYYKHFDYEDNMEKKANDVVALGFSEFVRSNIKTLTL